MVQQYIKVACCLVEAFFHCQITYWSSINRAAPFLPGCDRRLSSPGRSAGPWFWLPLCLPVAVKVTAVFFPSHTHAHQIVSLKRGPHGCHNVPTPGPSAPDMTVWLIYWASNTSRTVHLVCTVCSNMCPKWTLSVCSRWRALDCRNQALSVSCLYTSLQYPAADFIFIFWRTDIEMSIIIINF